MQTTPAAVFMFVVAAFLGALGQFLYKSGADRASGSVASYLLNTRLLGGVLCYVAVMVLFVAAFQARRFVNGPVSNLRDNFHLGCNHRVAGLRNAHPPGKHRWHGVAHRRHVFHGATVKAVVVAALLWLTTFAVSADDSLGKSLIDAVVAGDVAQSRQLIQQWRGTGKSFPLGPDDKPLLFLAIEGREKTHPEIVELLLANGADVQTRGPMGMTALHWAASHGYAERTTQLLQHHAQVEATDDFDRTPLHVAHSDAAEKLLAAHANWIALDKNGNTSLHYAAEDGPRHLELLFRAGFNVIDARNNSGLTPSKT